MAHLRGASGVVLHAGFRLARRGSQRRRWPRRGRQRRRRVVTRNPHHEGPGHVAGERSPSATLDPVSPEKTGSGARMFGGANTYRGACPPGWWGPSPHPLQGSSVGGGSVYLCGPCGECFGVASEVRDRGLSLLLGAGLPLHIDTGEACQVEPEADASTGAAASVGDEGCAGCVG